MKFFLPLLAYAAVVMPAVFANNDVSGNIEESGGIQRRDQDATNTIPPESKLYTDSSLTPLEQRWFVGDPTLTYNNGTGVFEMTWISSYGSPAFGRWRVISMETFDKCPNGDEMYQNATEVEGDYESSVYQLYYTRPTWMNQEVPDSDYWYNGLNWIGWSYVDVIADVFYVEMKWAFSIDSSVSGFDEVYSETTPVNPGDPVVGIVEFCTRVGRLDPRYDANGDQEFVTYGSNNYWRWLMPNFRQIKVTIEYDLSVEGFAVEGFTTQAIAATTSGVSGIKLSAKAELCPQERYQVDNFNQGEEICLDVCADDTLGLDADVMSVSSMIMSIVDSPNNAAQVLILQGSTLGGAVEYFCERDAGSAADATNDAPDGCCRVKFLLEGMFFPVVAGDTPGNATVQGVGECLLSLQGVTRRLEISAGPTLRGLQEDQQAEFEGKFQIMTTEAEEPASVATTIMTFASIAGAAGVALFLL